MWIIVGIVVLYILWSLFTGSEDGKMVLFLGVVALLAYIGSLIIQTAIVIYIKSNYIYIQMRRNTV